MQELHQKYRKNKNLCYDQARKQDVRSFQRLRKSPEPPYPLSAYIRQRPFHLQLRTAYRMADNRGYIAKTISLKIFNVSIAQNNMVVNVNTKILGKIIVVKLVRICHLKIVFCFFIRPFYLKSGRIGRLLAIKTKRSRGYFLSLDSICLIQFFVFG